MRFPFQPGYFICLLSFIVAVAICCCGVIIMFIVRSRGDAAWAQDSARLIFMRCDLHGRVAWFAREPLIFIGGGPDLAALPCTSCPCFSVSSRVHLYAKTVPIAHFPSQTPPTIQMQAGLSAHARTPERTGQEPTDLAVFTTFSALLLSDFRSTN